jgi:hypothetical protein
MWAIAQLEVHNLFFGLVILKYSLFLIQSFIPAQQQHKI